MYTLKSSEFRFKNYLHEITEGKQSCQQFLTRSEGRKTGGLALGTNRIRGQVQEAGVGDEEGEPQWREVTEAQEGDV